MRLRDWEKRADALENRLRVAGEKYDRALQLRNKFFRDTVGMAPGEVATLKGTVKMICRVLDMKKSR